MDNFCIGACKHPICDWHLSAAPFATLIDRTENYDKKGSKLSELQGLIMRVARRVSYLFRNRAAEFFVSRLQQDTRKIDGLLNNIGCSQQIVSMLALHTLALHSQDNYTQVLRAILRMSRNPWPRSRGIICFIARILHVFRTEYTRCCRQSPLS